MASIRKEPRSGEGFSIDKDPASEYYGQRVAFVVYYRDRGKRQHKQVCRTKREAIAVAAEKTTDRRRGVLTNPAGGRRRLEEYAREVIANGVSAGRLRPSTQELYEGHLRRYIEPSALGRMELAAIEPSDVEAFLGRMRSGNAGASTVRHVYQFLRRVFRTALEQRLVGFNPMNGVEKQTSTNKRANRYLRPEEVHALADAAGGIDAVLIRFLAWTGLRIGEAAGVRVRDFGLDFKTVTVREQVTDIGGRPTISEPKTPKAKRTVPIPDWLREDLKLAAAGKTPEEHVFTTEGGTLFRAGNWRRRVLYPAAETAGLRTVRPHDLRHTYASLAASEGVDIYRLMRRMGHASIGTTIDLYAADLFPDVGDASEFAGHAPSSGRRAAL